MPGLSELKKALTTSNSPQLLPYDLSPIIEEELMVEQPLIAVLAFENANGLTHEFTLRSTHPRGWFEGETTPANSKNSTYIRKFVKTKIMRIWGSVAGFAQAMDETFVDALETEMSGSIEGLSNVLEFGALCGCADDLGFTGDAYQFSGIIPTILSKAPENVVDAGGAKITLDFLDQATARVNKFRGVKADPKLWFMDSRMKQTVDGLQTRVQIPLTQVHLTDGKITMDAYDGIGIVESAMMAPATISTSPAVIATAAAEGSLTAGSYTYQLASVTFEGEQVAGSTSAGATVDITNKKVNLTWTHDDNAMLYMVFRKKDAGNFALVDIIPALTYDGAGTVNGVVEAYTDDGKKDPIATVRPLAAGERCVLLADINPKRGAAFVGKVDDMGRTIETKFNFIELARTKDAYDYFLKCYIALRIKYPNLFALLRHVKLA